MSEAQPHLGHHSGVFVIHERLSRLRAHGETSHTEHGLTYVADGWFRMEHGSQLTARSGSMTIVPAGVPHRTLDGHDVEYWLVGFCATCVQLDESQVLMRPFRDVRHGALPIVTIASSRRRRLLRLFRDLRDECQRAAPESPELIRSLLVLVLGEVHRAMPGGASVDSQRGALVSEALAFIQRRCLDSISLRDVAAAVHRTPAHVATTVKSATGYSVGAWINSGRVGEAANRLAHTDDSIDEITQRVGWQDRTHFIRQFRKAYGVTPIAWRRQQRGSHSGG